MQGESSCERCGASFSGRGYGYGRYCTHRCRRAAYMAEHRAADPAAWREKMRQYRADPDNAERQREANRKSRARAYARAKAEGVNYIDPKKARAREAVKAAIQSGRLQREPCLFCGVEETQAHHHDYSKRLEVTWLCVRHHALVHTQLPERRAA